MLTKTPVFEKFPTKFATGRKDERTIKPPSGSSPITGAQPLRLDQSPRRRLDRRFGAGRSAELASRIVGVEIDYALGRPEDLRDLGRRLAPRQPRSILRPRDR